MQEIEVIEVMIVTEVIVMNMIEKEEQEIYIKEQDIETDIEKKEMEEERTVRKGLLIPPAGGVLLFMNTKEEAKKIEKMKNKVKN